MRFAEIKDRFPDVSGLANTGNQRSLRGCWVHTRSRTRVGSTIASSRSLLANTGRINDRFVAEPPREGSTIASRVLGAHPLANAVDQRSLRRGASSRTRGKQHLRGRLGRSLPLLRGRIWAEAVFDRGRGALKIASLRLRSGQAPRSLLAKDQRSRAGVGCTPAREHGDQRSLRGCWVHTRSRTRWIKDRLVAEPPREITWDQHPPRGARRGAPSRRRAGRWRC